MRKNKLFLSLIAFIAFVPMAWAWNGDGTENNPYQITSASDWNTLATNVNNGNNYSGSYFQLTGNITVNTMVGSSRDKRFSGIFDGNGHTLTFNYTDNSSSDYCAPFRFIKGATIRNLHVAGSIEKKHNKNAGGLVGLAEGTNTINSCRSSIDIYISFTSEGDCSSGGFVGEMRYRSNTTFNNCLFDGKLRGAKAYKWGGFVGWVADGCTATFNNCLFDPTEVDVKNKSNKDFARFDSGDDPVLTDCYRKNNQLSNDQGTNASGYTNEQLLAALGGGWEIITENDVAKVLPIIAIRHLDGEGSATLPYLISSTEDWDNFAANVFLGQSYSGKYLKLTNNINITRMVGYDSSHTFQGTFDGDGHTLTVTLSSNARWCAPFAFTYGATIKNLVTAGTIETSNTNAGGVVGRNGTGNLTLTNVTSNVTINTTYGGDAQHGGLVGYTINADLNGCAFTGKLRGGTSRGCSGLIGWKTNTTDSRANITDCLFAPTTVMVTATDAYTLARNSSGGVVNITNCYYTQSLGAVQGKQAHSITPGEYVTVENAGTATVYAISGITSYGTGIKYNNVLYAGQSENVALNLNFFGTIPEGHQLQYSVSGGTLTGSDNTYTLTMPNADVVVNASAYVIPWQGEGNEGSPYLISNADLWNLLSERVNGGNTYSGKYFRLDADISVTTMVGIDGHRFSGHFDGNGHTLSVSYNTNEQHTAPFRYIEGAEISNLHITGDITTSKQFAAGFVAHAQGNNRMTNCRSSVTINSSVDGDGTHGGFVAVNTGGTFTMEGCTFDGSMLGSSTNKCGGFVGWNETNGSPEGTVIFRNCFFAPASITVGIEHTYARSRINDGGHVQMYYSNCRTNFGDNQQFRAYSISAGNDVTMNANVSVESTYTVSGLTMFITGMMYDGVLYARNEQSMSLNLGYTGTGSLSGFGTTEGSLSGDSNPFTLTMGTADAVINAITGGSGWSGSGSGTSESPYIISSNDEWNEFVSKVTNGVFGFSTAYYKLADNITSITVTTMVGTDGHKFKGHFDGNSKTLTLSYGSADAPFSENYCAPFRYIEGADIHNLIVDGNIYTSHQFAAGIAGYALNNNTITDCRSSITINSSASGDGTHGGFVANCQNYTDGATYVTFTRCVFNGQLLGSATSECGGFLGWAAGNDWAGVKFIDCIFAPSEVSILTDGSATFSRRPNNSDFITVTVENSYYTQSFGIRQGEMAYVTQPANVTTEAMTIAGVTIYVKKTLVTDVAATEITPTTATISWTGSNTCSNYQVRYRVKPDNTLYFTDFEDGLPDGWTMFDNDNDEHNWTYDDGTKKGMAHSGKGCMYSASYINNYGAVQPDNWLVSPQLTLGGTMKVWLRGQDEDEYGEHFAIYLSLAGNSKADFLDANGSLLSTVVTLVPETETTNAYQEYTANLSNYSGNGYIAIRHFNCYDQFYLVVDDFGLYDDNAGDPWTVVSGASPTTITGLTPNTEYEYQVGFDYGGNTFYTTKSTLTTLSEDVAPFNLRATVNSANTATIHWTGYGDSYNLRYSQGGAAKVTLSVPEDIWQDGSGYQMLLDEDHDTYGSVIPETGGLTISGDASPETYALFEYKIPENADGAMNTSHVVDGSEDNKSVTITIPAGIYDWCITNPSPDDRVWIASQNGNVGGRQNDFVFEAGKHYTFTVSLDNNSGNDCVNMTVVDDATISDQGEVINVTGITSTSFTLSSLADSTDYTVYVQSVKGNKTSEWSSIHFTTLGKGALYVAGYGTNTQDFTKWVFIASPVSGSIDPTTVSGLVPRNANGDPVTDSTDYDLYYFDQTGGDNGKEWKNYKSHSDNFIIENGRGYLYATKNDVVLTFTGTINQKTDTVVALDYTAGKTFAGWNLVGNPFAVAATIDRNYYKISEDGKRVDPTEHSESIPACTGVMVKADGMNESVVFTAVVANASSTPSKGSLHITVSQQNTRGKAVQDKAILSFNTGSRLEKFVFNKELSKLYIPQGGQDYAIAFSDKQGEMPLNFKATENGTYTISVNPENVELAYLHLIDNLTGADVDLLALRQAQGPASYTFTAKTTDYESRFRLIFVTKEDGPSTGSGAFAFISNGNIIVNGEGTLQVIDMTGRVIVSGDAINRVSTSRMPAGVYVLRLINGENVKVQKIVVR